MFEVLADLIRDAEVIKNDRDHRDQAAQKPQGEGVLPGPGHAAPPGPIGTDRGHPERVRLNPVPVVPVVQNDMPPPGPPGKPHPERATGNPAPVVPVAPVKIGNFENESHGAAVVSHPPAPAPPICYACRGRSWWRRYAGHPWICARCHPPATSAIVLERMGHEPEPKKEAQP